MAGAGFVATTSLARAGDDLPGGQPSLDAPVLVPGDPAPKPVITSTPAPAPTLATDPAPQAAPAPAPAQALAGPDTPPAPARPAAVLAIPGMMRSARSPRPAVTSAPAPELIAPVGAADPAPATPVGRLSLEPPLAEYGRDDLPAALPSEASTDRVTVARPALPDSLGEPSLDAPTLGARETPEPSADPFPVRTPSSSTSGKPVPRIEPTPRDGRNSAGGSSSAAPRRRLFGLLPAPAAARANVASRPASDRTPKSGEAGLEHDDPEAAAQETLRRRIEKQARLYAGDRARSVEVQLDKRHATVRATGVRFYQKRAVRKSLESLPALSGLHSTIEVLD